MSETTPLPEASLRSEPRSQRIAQAFALMRSAFFEERPSLLSRLNEVDPEILAEARSLLRYELRDQTLLRSAAGPFAAELRSALQAAAPSQPLRDSDRIGPYEIVRQLGSGGMGRVYLARQTEPITRDVALKVIRAEMVTPAVVLRFARERQALALMEHPNIARVFEAGNTPDGQPFFAMEFVPGMPIVRYCDDRRLSIPERIGLFLQVCAGVQHAHLKSILHRDLKPANILVHWQNDRHIAKIIDFGIAKLMGSADAQTMFTRIGDFVGTPLYMSPEQRKGGVEDIDARADVYALGVVLYELLSGPLSLWFTSGVLPLDFEFPRPSDPSKVTMAAWHACALERRCSGADLERNLRGELDWIAKRALDPDRNRRYQNASELAADLERYLERKPVLAGPPSPRYRMRKFIARNRALVVASASAFVLLVAGLIATSYLYYQNLQTVRLATAQRDDILRLSDGNLLEHSVAELDLLWPASPEVAPRLLEWLEGAPAQLAARRPEHEKMLRELEARIFAGVTEDSLRHAALERVDSGTRFQYELAEKLVLDLNRYFDPDPAIGAVARGRARWAFANSVDRVSIENHAAEWEDAIASIADLRECPAYEGLRIIPQIGLVPIGRDVRSGLWEFAHLETGEIARRDATGQLVIAEETGMVFVLLPGARATIGALPPTADRPLGSSYVAKNAAPNEAPLTEVNIDPFFISKYEMTQGQWVRTAFANPSEYQPGLRGLDYVHDLRFPVENVSWITADVHLRRMGLLHATEAQWEYAARAGTTTPWHTGTHPEDTRRTGNWADQACLRGGLTGWGYVNWDDGWVRTSPVGCFEPNPFGLHDMLGNVMEWTRDALASYTSPRRPGDGELIVTDVEFRVSRGGTWNTKPESMRVSRRHPFPPTHSTLLAPRPVRCVDPSPPVRS